MIRIASLRNLYDQVVFSLATIGLTWLLCQVASAQLDAKVTTATSLVGVNNARMVGSTIIVDADSAPTLVPVAIIDIDTQCKFVDVEATGPNGIVDLQKVSETQWVLASEGTFAIAILGFDPDKGIFKKRLTVELGKPKPPQPPGPPGPQPPPDDALSGLSKDSRAAIVGLVQGMARDLDQLAVDAKSKKIKTVAEASAQNANADVSTRAKFKTEMAKIMAPKLGNTTLDDNAPAVFSEIANGFRSVK